MIAWLQSLYRKWRALTHKGMTDHGWTGLAAYQNSKAIAFFVSIVPIVPLMVSDELGFGRGWLWFGWSAIAVLWFAAIWILILTAAFREVSKQFKKRP